MASASASGSSPDLSASSGKDKMETLTSRWIRLLETGDYSDVTLLVGKDQIPIKAHKLVLIASSSYFEEQFLVNNVMMASNIVVVNLDQGDDVEPKVGNSSTTLSFDDVDPDDFRLFLKFIYGGIGDIKVDQAMPLMICGKQFQVPSLVEECEAVLKRTITLDSALTLFEQALKYKSVDLEKSAANFICKNAYTIVLREEFERLTVEAIKLLIECDDFQVKDEMQLFEAVIKWAKAECNRQEMDPNNMKYMRSVLEPVLRFIRFPQMAASDFALKVARLKILTSDEVVDILPYFHVSQNERATLPSEFFVSTTRRYYQPEPPKPRAVLPSEYENYMRRADPNFHSYAETTWRRVRELQ